MLILKRIANAERQQAEFVAPSLKGGKVKVRILGIVAEYSSSYEGWGVFLPDGKKAKLVTPASLALKQEYMDLLRPILLRLAYKLNQTSWLAFPVNASDMQQKFGYAKPVAVHFVENAETFGVVRARCDGNFWYERTAYNIDPSRADYLRTEFNQHTAPDAIKGTYEERTTYALLVETSQEFEALRQQKAIRKAVEFGGGTLENLVEEKDFWRVTFSTPTGQRTTASIGKNHRVESAGFCLARGDKNFDLESLVGILDHRYQRREYDEDYDD